MHRAFAVEIGLIKIFSSYTNTLKCRISLIIYLLSLCSDSISAAGWIKSLKEIYGIKKTIKFGQFIVLLGGPITWRISSPSWVSFPIIWRNSVNLQHNYRTRLASKSSFSLPKARTNYGKFSIRFAGTQIWNSVDESIKKTTSISNFKIQMKQSLINLFYM